MTRVDVVIPCYNYARFLNGCVESVLMQEGVDVRLLIIDDCSQDDSALVGAALASQNRRIEFCRHAENCGHIATYNEGLLGWAEAEYSLLLSADDLLAPGALQRATRVMDLHPEVGMTYGLAQNFQNNEIPDASHELVSDEYQVLSSENFLRRCFEYGNCVPTPTAVVRTSLQKQLGGYNPDLPHSGDMEMWMRFAAHAPVGVVKALQAYYRKHSSNMSNKYYNRLLSDQREVLHACEKILDCLGGHYPESFGWRRAVRRQIGERAFWSASQAFEDGDLKGCRNCLQFSVEIFPEIRETRSWRRLQCKRLAGQFIWQCLRPILNRLREQRATMGTDGISMLTPVDQLVGWWPGASG